VHLLPDICPHPALSARAGNPAGELEEGMKVLFKAPKQDVVA